MVCEQTEEDASKQCGSCWRAITLAAASHFFAEPIAKHTSAPTWSSSGCPGLLAAAGDGICATTKWAAPILPEVWRQAFRWRRLFLRRLWCRCARRTVGETGQFIPNRPARSNGNLTRHMVQQADIEACVTYIHIILYVPYVNNVCSLMSRLVTALCALL